MSMEQSPYRGAKSFN